MKTLLLLLAFALVCAEGRPCVAEEPAAAGLESLGEGRFRIGNVLFEKEAGQITLPGRVNMNEGLIEVFACTERGKLHEATLVLDVDPLHLQLALISLGLEYGRVLEEQGEARRPEGDPVLVFVEWGEGESKQRWRAEDLIWNGPAESPMEHVSWVFAGSKVINGTFMASVEGQLITTYHDPYAILDNPLESGADDTVYFSNQERLPSPGTPITMVIEDARSRD